VSFRGPINMVQLSYANMVMRGATMVQRTWMQDLCLGIILYATRYVGLWFIIGSSHLFFSGMTIFGSLVGLYAIPRTLCIWIAISSVRCFTNTTFAAPLQTLSVYHIPTQAAAWYWKIFETNSTRDKIFFLKSVFFVLPLFCMALFIVHPVGYYAAPYTLYWLIPSVIALIPHPHRLLRALGSTFTAHAIGSVLWIWTHPTMSAAMWLNLIPVVACERLLFATMIWASSNVIDRCLEKGCALLKAYDASSVKVSRPLLRLVGKVKGLFVPNAHEVVL
jgi:hypothetical protein